MVEQKEMELKPILNSIYDYIKKEKTANSEKNKETQKQYFEELKSFYEKELKQKISDLTKKDIKIYLDEKDISSRMIEFSEIAGYYLSNAKEYSFNKHKNRYEAKSKSLSTSQLRNFFGEVKSIQSSKDYNKVKLLKPKLAYVAQKSQSDAMDFFKDAIKQYLDYLIYDTDNENIEIKFDRFVELLESILAYHKAYGGN